MYLYFPDTPRISLHKLKCLDFVRFRGYVVFRKEYILYIILIDVDKLKEIFKRKIATGLWM